MSCLTFLGLCLRAGKLAIGEETVGAAARDKKARLIMSASDAAHGSLMRAENYARTAKAPFIVLPYTKDELGAVIGRGTPGMLAVTDFGLASAFADKLATEHPGPFDEAAATLRVSAERAEKRRQEKRRHIKNVKSGKKSGRKQGDAR